MNTLRQQVTPVVDGEAEVGSVVALDIRELRKQDRGLPLAGMHVLVHGRRQPRRLTRYLPSFDSFDEGNSTIRSPRALDSCTTLLST